MSFLSGKLYKMTKSNKVQKDGITSNYESIFQCIALISCKQCILRKMAKHWDFLRTPQKNCKSFTFACQCLFDTCFWWLSCIIPFKLERYCILFNKILKMAIHSYVNVSLVKGLTCRHTSEMPFFSNSVARKYISSLNHRNKNQY